MQGHGRPRGAARRERPGAEGGLRPLSAEALHELRVRFAECDPQAIVFNSRYLEYFDVAITELWRETLGSYDGVMEELGIDLVVAEARVRYRGSLRFDDRFLMRTTIANLGTTSMTTRIGVERDGTEVVEGELRHVFVGRDGSGKKEIPARVRQALQPYVREAS